MWCEKRLMIKMANDLIQDKTKDLESKIIADVENELQDGVYDVEPYEPTPRESVFVKLKNSKLYARLAKRTWLILLPFFLVTIFLIITPLVGIVVFSVIKPVGGSMVFETSLEKYVYLFSNSSIWIALGLGLLFAVVASVCSVVVAYPIAYMMANLKNKFLVRNVWVIVTMPIWINTILKIIGLQSLFYMLAPTALGTEISIIIGMIYLFLPFAISPIYNSLENRDLSYEKAALDLGASKTKTFWQHTFRFSIPGVVTGFSLVLIQSATSLIVVRYMGIGKINLITNVIESYFFMGSDFGYGAAISVILAVIVFAILALTKLVSNKFESGKVTKKWKNS
jgi:spermidine/putrescine transport system permease protein